MKILGIDTSGSVATVAVTDDDILMGEYTVDYKKTHSQTLLPMTDALLSMLELRIKDMDAIAVAAGPGSFTGLRIGIATVKGFGLVNDAPVIPVHTVDALAYNLWGGSGLICPLMDARRRQTYTGLYKTTEKGDFETVLSQRAISIAEIIAEVNKRGTEVTFLGDGVPVFIDEIREKCKVPFRLAPPHLMRQHAGSVAALGRRLFDEGRYASADELKPEYLRMSQAERERMEREAHIRIATGEDVARLAELSAANMDDPWNERSFLETIASDNARVYILGDYLGYAVVYVNTDEAELPQIAIDTPHRGCGYGGRLLRFVMQDALERGADNLYLEVRAGNEAAIRLYESQGMEENGRRPGFYSEPTEDALLYKKKLRGQDA